MKSYLSARQIRSVKVTAAQLRRRVIFLAGGIAVGAAAVVLAQVSDWAQIAFGAALAKSRYASFVITPVGFALSVFLTIRYFPNSQGSGIPQASPAASVQVIPLSRTSVVPCMSPIVIPYSVVPSTAVPMRASQTHHGYCTSPVSERAANSSG